jgi:eukaryotic-like serine/threonine-protein kinase
MPLFPGTRMGRYEVRAALGAGGTGEVYRAADPRAGRDVALKILPEAFSKNPERRAQFEKEARAASDLHHPGIVTVYDIATELGMILYIVTELIDGSTLRQARPETLAQQLDVGAQAAETMAAVHAAGLTHRDLKPENVIVSREGRVKIVDFGIARPADESAPEGDTITAAITTPGTTLKTVGYVSPEQARGRPVDHRTDIFALGAILYELFSGRRAFDGESPADVLSAILKLEPPDLTPPVPGRVREAVKRCLDKDPSRRLASMQELAVVLRKAALAAPRRQWLTGWLRH